MVGKIKQSLQHPAHPKSGFPGTILARCDSLRLAIQQDFEKHWARLVEVRDELQNAIDTRDDLRLHYGISCALFTQLVWHIASWEQIDFYNDKRSLSFILGWSAINEENIHNNSGFSNVDQFWCRLNLWSPSLNPQNICARGRWASVLYRCLHTWGEQLQGFLGQD